MPVRRLLRAAPAALRQGRRAVVDIGSNSIRLVVFDRLARAPLLLFNEKVLCGLGRGLDETGRLNEAGVESAMVNLVRFVRLARAMGVTKLDMLATAAVRDAADGEAFVAALRRRCGVPVRIISGAEEAKFSALGVISGCMTADGMMGDLGGGSLELVGLDMGKLGAHATLPLGPLRVGEVAFGEREEARQLVDQHLETVPWLGDLRGRDFYAVGGAWRSLARIHMEQTGHPLHIIQQYRIERRQAEDLLRIMSRLGRRSLAAIAGLSRRRVDSLPFAALVLERLLRLARPANIVFSAFGLREGFLFSQLPAAQRRQEPLLAAAKEIARENGRFGALGPALEKWTAPLFAGESEAEARMRLAVHDRAVLGQHQGQAISVEAQLGLVQQTQRRPGKGIGEPEGETERKGPVSRRFVDEPQHGLIGDRLQAADIAGGDGRGGKDALAVLDAADRQAQDAPEGLLGPVVRMVAPSDVAQQADRQAHPGLGLALAGEERRGPFRESRT